MSLASFGVHRPVLANLFMFGLIVAGLFAAVALRKEFFPETEPDTAIITAIYPGASPEEIESNLALKVEDKISELDEVKKISSSISEGVLAITVKFKEDIRDPDLAVRKVERAVDELQDIPPEVERITVTTLEPELPVIQVNVFGVDDEYVLKESVLQIKDELKTLPGMGDPRVSGVRKYEIRIEVDEPKLLMHGISLPQVADRVRAMMVEVPGGTVRTSSGYIKVRTMGVTESSLDIRNIIVKSDADGSVVRLSEIANIRESFTDDDVSLQFNGLPSAALTVFKVGQQDVVRIAEMTRGYVEGRQEKAFIPDGMIERAAMSLTPGSDGLIHTVSARYRGWKLGSGSAKPLGTGVTLDITTDLSRFVSGRLDLLLRNAMQGGVLVLLLLFFFLNWRAALWVGIGMLTALMGTLFLMYVAGQTLNFLSMFGLIIVVGILVDDGIVVAENILTWKDNGAKPLDAAVKGTNEVAWPVLATVSTNVAAFLPLTMVKGQIGDLLGALPIVVTCAMVMSLFESLMVLPSHMGHGLVHREHANDNWFSRKVNRFELWRDDLVFNRLLKVFGRFVEFCFINRYGTIAVAVATLIVSIGMVAGGRAVYDFLPGSDAETVIVDVDLPIGAPTSMTKEVVAAIAKAAKSQPEVTNVVTLVGQRSDIETGSTDSTTPHKAQMFIELQPVEFRDRESNLVTQSIREQLVGKIDQVEKIRFSPLTGGPAGADITIALSGKDPQILEQASRDLRSIFLAVPSVVDVSDDNQLGQREFRFVMKPGAESIGFTNESIARQVRSALYGVDAHTFSANREDIDVRVRFNDDMATSFWRLSNLWLVSPSGQAVPAREVAELNDSVTYSTIKRVDRMRTLTVSADVVPGVSPNDVLNAVPLGKLQERYPSVKFDKAGKQEQEADAFASLPLGFMAALVGIYVILAWLFNSYIQPVVVMSIIPFSLIGVIWGHYLLGYSITFLSIIGFMALTGIIVNDTLVYIQFFNARRDEGMAMREALVLTSLRRFRAIFLTTITTVCGLLPMIAEQSFQAKFLIPMAITISFGLMSATLVVLIVLPGFLYVIDDMKRAAYFLWTGSYRPEHGTMHELESSAALHEMDDAKGR